MAKRSRSSSIGTSASVNQSMPSRSTSGAVPSRPWLSAPRRMASATRVAIPVCDSCPGAASNMPIPWASAPVSNRLTTIASSENPSGRSLARAMKANTSSSASTRGAVVGQHVDPVVLGEQRRRRAGEAREREAAGRVELPHAAAERAGRQVTERGPPRGQLGVVARHRPRVGRARGRGALRVRSWRPPVRVAVAVEVDRRQAGVAVGQLVGDVQHAVVDAEGPGVGDDAVGDGHRQRTLHQRHQHHHLHDAHPERLVAPGQRGGQLGGLDRAVVGHVDRVAGHRLEHRRDEHRLQRGRPALGADGGQHGVAELLDLERARRLQVEIGVGRERHPADATGDRFRPDPGRTCDQDPDQNELRASRTARVGRRRAGGRCAGSAGGARRGPRPRRRCRASRRPAHVQSACAHCQSRPAPAARGRPWRRA